MTHRFATKLGGLLVAFVPASAAAAHPSVTLEMEGCETAHPDEVRRIARIELGGLLTDDAPSSNTARVIVHCGDERVDLRIHDPVTSKSMTRSLDWQRSAAIGRSRLLALAIAEIVSASWTELESTAPPTPAAVDAPQTVRVEGRTATTSSLRILLVGEVREWLQEPTLALGGGVRVERDISTSLGWSVDVLGHHGERSVALGNISVEALSSGASLMFHRAWVPLTLCAGPGLRLGIARVRGEPLSDAAYGDSITGVWGGPFATGRGSVALSKKLALGAGVEGGVGLFDVIGRADGVRAAVIGGPWIAGAVSFGLLL